MKKYNIHLKDGTILRNVTINDLNDQCFYKGTTETKNESIHESVIDRIVEVKEPDPVLPKPTTRKTAKA